jgi:hypothetical protein
MGRYFPNISESVSLELESRYDQEFPLLHVLHNGYGVHPASYAVGARGSFNGSKAVEA